MALLSNLFVVAAGYTGFQDHPREEEHRNYHTYNAYDAYTAGLSEEEQLERAVRASLRDQGGSFTSFPYFKTDFTWRGGLQKDRLTVADQTLKSLFYKRITR